MALDKVTLNQNSTSGKEIGVDNIAGVDWEVIKMAFGVAGVLTLVEDNNPLPVKDEIAENALAALVANQQSDGLTNTQLRATPVEVSGTVSVDTTGLATSAKQDTGNTSLADILAKIIAAPSTEAKQDAANALLTTIAAITQPLTDTQLRATPVPISGTVAVTGGGDATAANQTSQITQETAINTILGLISDAIVAAGATGSVSAKLRRATQGLEDLKSLIVLAAGTNIIGKAGIDQTTDGTTNKVRATATQKPSIGATVVMTVTNLQSLASSATAGWQSARVSNLSTLANDYEIFVKLTTANTAAANDKCMYVFICPFYTTDAGSTWLASSQGTTTLPTGTEGTTTIASPHNLRLLGVLNYTTTQMVVQDTFLLSNCFGNRLPDGFSIIIINFSGAALSTSCVVDYSPINDTLV